MPGSPMVSIVIVNWNRLEDVLKTLHYLDCQRGVCYEVIVVDNGSTDESTERLSHIPSIRFVPLDSNEGPAKRGMSGSSTRRENTSCSSTATR